MTGCMPSGLTMALENLANTPVLVTGGAGFIGSHLCQKLSEIGSRVMILDNLDTGSVNRLPANLCHLRSDQSEGAWTHCSSDTPVLVEGSIVDHELVKTLLKGAISVIHLAAIASVQRSLDNPLLHRSVNIEATRNLIDECDELTNIRSFLFASSAAIYGTTDQLPIVESTGKNPTSIYGKGKWLAERLVLGKEGGMDEWISASKPRRTPVSGLRFFNVYGPGQDPSSPYSGVLSIFHDLAKNGQPITIHGDGKQSRDFIHVSDVVSAIVDVTHALLEGGVASALHAQAFNISTGSGVSLLNVIDILEAEYGPLDVEHGPVREGDIKHSHGSSDLIQQCTIWKPNVLLKEGLVSLISDDRPLA